MKSASRDTLGKHIFTFLLCFIAFGMANLNILMSIGSILLVLTFMWHPGPKRGWKGFVSNRPAMAMAGLYLMHLLWLVNTEDFDYAANDLRIKLPLLVFALVIGGVQITRQQVKWVFLALSLGLWVASIHAYVNYAAMDGVFIDFRDIVRGISHIRLSLMMVLLVVAIIFYWPELSKVWRAYALASAINVLIFFNVIQSASGVLTLITLLLFTAYYYAYRHYAFKGLALVLAANLLCFGVTYIYLDHYYQRYFSSNESLENLPTNTALGSDYDHYTEVGQVENGHYTFLYLAEGEMLNAWDERSTLSLRGEEKAMERAVLIRYLSSLGLPKDYSGVMALSEEDVRNVEAGVPSIVYARKQGLALRLHTTVFGYHLFRLRRHASGSSLFQRLVFWEAAAELIQRHFWLGTGTGDVRKAFEEVYEELKINLAQQYRLRAHNQFLTFFVSFGLMGFLFFMLLFFLPFRDGPLSYLHIAFLLIAFISCLTEDTLETQAGVTFFAFFYSLLSMPERTRGVFSGRSVEA